MRKTCFVQNWVPYQYRVAQNAPNRSDLPSQLIFPSLLPSWWGKCIESPKKLMPRGSPCEAPFWPDFIRGCTPTNDIFWSRSFLTPLNAWTTPTNIGKHLGISQYPTQDPKRTKIVLMDQILVPWSDLEAVKMAWKIKLFYFFQISSTFWQPVDLETCENYSAHENAFLWKYSAPYLVIFGGKALGYAKMFPNVCLGFPGI